MLDTGTPVAGVVERHQVFPASERSYRHAASDDLSERSHVRGHAVVLLRAAARKPECDHLVENQDDAEFGSQGPESGQKFRLGGDEATLTVDRLDDDRRKPVGVGADDLFARGQVVVRHDDDVIHDPGRDALEADYRVGAECVAGAFERRLNADRDGVVVTVVRALALCDYVVAGKRPGRPDGVESRFGAGVDEPDHVDRGNAVDHDFGPLDDRRAWRGERYAVVELVPHGLDDRRVTMAEYEGRHVVDHVDALIAVDVVQPRSVAPGHVDGERRPPNGVAGVAPRHDLGGALVQAQGLLVACYVAVKIGLKRIGHFPVPRRPRPPSVSGLL